MEFRQLHKHPEPLTLYRFRIDWGVRLNLLKNSHPSYKEKFTSLFKASCYHLFEVMAYYGELITLNDAISEELARLNLTPFCQPDPKANLFQQAISSKPTKVKKKKLKALDRKLLANYPEQFDYASEACINEQVERQSFLARFVVDYAEIESAINKFVFDTHLQNFNDLTPKIMEASVQYLFQIYDYVLVYYSNLYELAIANKYLLCKALPEHQLVTDYAQLQAWQPTTVKPKIKSKHDVDISIEYGTGFADYPPALSNLASKEVAAQSQNLDLKLEKLRRAIDSQRLKIDPPYIRVPRPSLMAGNIKNQYIAQISDLVSHYYENLTEINPEYNEAIDVDRFLILMPYVINYCVVNNYNESQTKQFLDENFIALIEEFIAGKHEKYRDHTYDFKTGGKLNISKTAVPVLHDLANMNTRVKDENKILAPLSEMLDSRLIEAESEKRYTPYPATLTEVLNLANLEAQKQREQQDQAKDKIELQAEPDSTTTLDIPTENSPQTNSVSTVNTISSSSNNNSTNNGSTARLEFPLPSKSTPKSTSLALDFPIEPLEPEAPSFDLPLDPITIESPATTEESSELIFPTDKLAVEFTEQLNTSASASVIEQKNTPELILPTNERLEEDHSLLPATAKKISAKEKEKARLAAVKQKQQAKEKALLAKEKEKIRQAKEKEKEKARLAREKEKERLKQEKAKAKAKLAAEKAKEKEKARLAREKEKARIAKEKEKARLQKEKEKARRQKEKEKAQAKIAAEKEKKKEKLRLAKIKEEARLAKELAKVKARTQKLKEKLQQKTKAKTK